MEQEDTNFSGVLTFRPNTKVRQFQRHKKWNIFLDHNVCLILDVVSIHYQPLSNDLPPTAGHGQYVLHIGQISLAYPVLRRFNNDNAKKTPEMIKEVSAKLFCGRNALLAKLWLIVLVQKHILFCFYIFFLHKSQNYHEKDKSYILPSPVLGGSFG